MTAARSHDPGRPVVIVLAAGTGSRSGSPQPKQLLDLHGSPVFVHAVRPHVALHHHIVIVVSDDVRDGIEAGMAEHFPEIDADVVTGGMNRRESVVAGIAALPDATAADAAIIFHNASSPNTPTDLITSCIEALPGHDAIVAYVRSDATTILHSDGELVELIPRASSGFSTDPTIYRRDLADEIAKSIVEQPAAGDTTIDIALRLGARIGLVESPIDNRKITLPGDLERLGRSMDVISPPNG